MEEIIFDEQLDSSIRSIWRSNEPPLKHRNDVIWTLLKH